MTLRSLQIGYTKNNYVPTRREPPITAETGLHIKDTLFSYTMFFNIFCGNIKCVYAEGQLPAQHRNHVHVHSDEEEFDRELFEPINGGWDGDEDDMEDGHGLHNENLDDDDRFIQRHAQSQRYESYRALPEGLRMFSHMMIHMTTSTKTYQNDIN
jgi:hypothetical protein